MKKSATLALYAFLFTSAAFAFPAWFNTNNFIAQLFTQTAKAETIEPENIASPQAVMLAWDFSPLTGGANNYGANLFAAATIDPNLSNTAVLNRLVRGSGIGTTGTAAANAWGGTTFTGTSQANAISINEFVSFIINPAAGNAVSLSDIGPYNIRRSGTGPTTGRWQYQINSDPFVDIGSDITFGTNTTAAGNAQPLVDLSGIAALQNVPAGTTITLRLVVWGASAATGTWYFNDPTDTTAADLIVNGSTSALTPLNGTYTVGVGGDFETLTSAFGHYAASGVSGPVTFSLTDAAYSTGSLNIVASPGASAINTLTIKPAIGVSPTITSSGTDSVRFTGGASWVVIDGSNTVGGTTRDLTFTGSTSNGIYMVANANNNVVRNVNVINAGTSFIGMRLAEGSSGGTVSNNTLENNFVHSTAVSNPIHGFYLQGSTPISNQSNNIVIGNTINNFARGITILTSQSNLLVAGNTIFDTASRAQTISKTGIYLGSFTGEVTITGNRIYDLRSSLATRDFYGIYGFPRGGDTANITNNMISLEPSASGQPAYGIEVHGDGGVRNIYHNSVFLGGVDGAVTHGLADHSNNATNVSNNAVLLTRTGTGYYVSNAANLPALTSNYNNIVASTFGAVGVTTYADLAAWQAGTSKDANSISADPLFISTTDLHIDPAQYGSSPVSNAGTPIAGVTDDFDGDPRDPVTPDIGADEFVFPPNPGTVQFSAAGYSGLENGGVITVTATRTGGAAGAISVDYGEQVVVGGRNGKARNVRPDLKEADRKWTGSDIPLCAAYDAGKGARVPAGEKDDEQATDSRIPEGSRINTLPTAWIGEIVCIGRRRLILDPELVDITELPESFKKGIPPERYHEFFSDTPTFGDARDITRRADLRSEISDLRSGNGVADAQADAMGDGFRSQNSNLRSEIQDRKTENVLPGERAGRPLTRKDAIGGGTATGGASCTAGVDYVTPGGTLNWADGDAADKTFNIVFCPDSDFEPDETFNIELTNPTGGATLGSPSTATVTILNDDAEPVVPIVVTTTGDDGDANPGDGNCATGGGVCTLRAAVEEANALPGEQTIEIQLSGLGVPDVITLTSGTEIVITDDLIINGPGADQLTIDGGPASNRIFSSGTGVSLELTGMTLTGGNGFGTAGSQAGGAVFALGDLTLDWMHVTANTAATCGAVRVVAGTHAIRNTTLSGNTSTGSGGGLCAATSSNLIIESSTFSGNTSGTSGGAIVLNGASLLVSNSTIFANTASTGGGLQNTSSTATIRSSIIAGNTGGSPEISNNVGVVVSGGFNLIGDNAGDSANTGSAITYQTTDILDTPPLLGPLQDNGGPTLTHRPSALSPVIDAGDSFGLMTDQRGFARVFDFTTIFNVGDGADIGAFENLGPSRAAIEVSGKVITAEGMPIRGATLTVHGGAFTEPRTFVSGSMGTFELVGLRAGETYFIYVSAGRYTFAEPWITLTALDSISDMEIIGVAQF